MASRGPDADGLWIADGIALGHRRLAILDLETRANQPMVSSDGRYTIVFNGEIYNFGSLRRALEAEGVAFQTTSDTEVVLSLFARQGERMLSELRGMFAFAIWDSQKRELFLARDPYGIKPLYYAQIGRTLVFASQVKALRESGLLSSEREPAAVAGFYLWGSVPEPWTLFRGAFSVPAGHYIRYKQGAVATPICWFDIRESWLTRHGRISKSELLEQVRSAVTDSVRAHLVSDVPLSVFLSGGIDSSAIASLAVSEGASVEAITIGFEEFSSGPENETSEAAAIAAHLGLRHHVHVVTRPEFGEDMGHILAAMDQPSIDGVNTWFASKAAVTKGFKVALSGVGGDELFQGYSHFTGIPRAVAVGRAVAAIPGGKALLSPVCAYWARLQSQPKLAGLPLLMNTVEGMYFLRRGLFLPGDLPALMGAERARAGLTSLHRLATRMTGTEIVEASTLVGLLESTHYLRNQLLRDSDWASMSHSLELRTPLVDTILLRALGPHVSSFAHGLGKTLLAQAPREPLPRAVQKRPKTGFSVPMQSWLASPAQRRLWCEIPMLATPRTPWARRWAKLVLDEMPGCA